MKYKNLLLGMLLLFCSSVVVEAQNSVFEKLSAKQDIKTVRISQSLLEMLPKMETGGVDITSLADKVTQIEIYTSETAEAAKFMNSQTSFFEKDKSYDTFLIVKDKEQKAVFYGKKKNGKFEDLVMIADEGDKCTIVRMIGEFTTKDIQEIVAKK